MTFQQAIMAIIAATTDPDRGAPVVKRRDWGSNAPGFKFTAAGALRHAYDVDHDLEPQLDSELCADENVEDAIGVCLTPEDLSANDWAIE